MNEALQAQLRRTAMTKADMVRNILVAATRQGRKLNYNEILEDVFEKYEVVIKREDLFTMMARLYKRNEVSRRKVGHDVRWSWKEETV
jgi:hypothetical protein